MHVMMMAMDVKRCSQHRMTSKKTYSFTDCKQIL